MKKFLLILSVGLITTASAQTITFFNSRAFQVAPTPVPIINTIPTAPPVIYQYQYHSPPPNNLPSPPYGFQYIVLRDADCGCERTVLVPLQR